MENSKIFTQKAYVKELNLLLPLIQDKHEDIIINRKNLVRLKSKYKDKNSLSNTIKFTSCYSDGIQQCNEEISLIEKSMTICREILKNKPSISPQHLKNKNMTIKKLEVEDTFLKSKNAISPLCNLIEKVKYKNPENNSQSTNFRHILRRGELMQLLEKKAMELPIWHGNVLEKSLHYCAKPGDKVAAYVFGVKSLAEQGLVLSLPDTSFNRQCPLPSRCDTTRVDDVNDIRRTLESPSPGALSSTSSSSQYYFSARSSVASSHTPTPPIPSPPKQKPLSDKANGQLLINTGHNYDPNRFPKRGNLNSDRLNNGHASLSVPKSKPGVWRKARLKREAAQIAANIIKRHLQNSPPSDITNGTPKGMTLNATSTPIKKNTITHNGSYSIPVSQNVVTTKRRDDVVNPKILGRETEETGDDETIWILAQVIRYDLNTNGQQKLLQLRLHTKDHVGYGKSKEDTKILGGKKVTSVIRKELSRSPSPKKVKLNGHCLSKSNLTHNSSIIFKTLNKKYDGTHESSAVLKDHPNKSHNSIPDLCVSYEIEDIDESRERYIIDGNNVIPLPTSKIDPLTHPRLLLPVGSLVLARYPQTTCFYRAQIHATPKCVDDNYQIIFEDPLYPDGYSPPLGVPQHYVVPFRLPKLNE